ncbi:MAG: glycosyltransferase family 4 protein [Phycisphaerae bacterium]|nr:glycosyltransferase family 4 protein [Phycisphaerae bacterium]
MKILILTNNPSRASFRLRIAAHLDYLRQQGITSEVHVMSSSLRERWRLFKSSSAYDAILIHRKCLNFWDAQVLFHYAPTRIFDFDDAIMHSPACPDSDHTSHYRLFRRTAKKMDVMVAGNPTLADYARRYCKKAIVLPTGLDTTAYLKPKAAPKDGKIRFVWIGSKSTVKYLSQLKPVFEQIGKTHRNVVLRIIADEFFDLNNMEVEKRPWSVQTEVADLLACDVGLSPLPNDRFARGKCGFKMLQYFAAGLPVIASPVGVNETFIHESQAGVLAATSQQWIEAIEHLIANLNHWQQRGEEGRKYVRSFDVSVIGEKLCDIIKSTVAGSVR